MTTEIQQAFIDAYQSPDDDSLTNKAHRLFLSHRFIMPVRKNTDESTEPTVLFFSEKGVNFLPVFSNEQLLRQWAKESIHEMDWINVLGKDIALGTGENTYICLDVGQTHYKEFAPDEIAKLKNVVLKLERIAKSQSKAVEK